MSASIFLALNDSRKSSYPAQNFPVAISIRLLHKFMHIYFFYSSSFASYKACYAASFTDIWLFGDCLSDVDASYVCWLLLVEF